MYWMIQYLFDYLSSFIHFEKRIKHLDEIEKCIFSSMIKMVKMLVEGAVYTECLIMSFKDKKLNKKLFHTYTIQKAKYLRHFHRVSRSIVIIFQAS